jgi:microcystin-dependent protein
MSQRREYTSGRPTTLASPFAIGAGTFTIADDGSQATWPTGADHDFWVTIDAGTAQEERVLCSGRSVRVITVASGGRGQDGTSESNHSAGATVWPSWSATDADEANEHINLTTGVHGYTATAAEINILDGATLSTAELNILDGVTASTAELNILDGVIASTTELNYVDGVTSAIQTQLNTNTPVGTIVMYGGTTAPTGWLLCNGQATANPSALRDLIGTNVPDLMGRAPIGYGTSADTTNVPTARTTIGAKTGAETHTLTHAQIPSVAAASHVHYHQSPISLQSGAAMVLNMSDSTMDSYGGSYEATGTANIFSTNIGFTSSQAVEQWLVTSSAAANVGGGGAHNNMQPSTVVNFIIKT